MTTEERLENLEREWVRVKRHNRRLAAVFALSVLAFCFAWIVEKTAPTSQAGPATATVKPPPAVHGSSLVLVDEQGQDRARLEMTKTGPWLLFLDDHGNPLTAIGAGKFRPNMYRFDKQGNPQHVAEPAEPIGERERDPGPRWPQ
jgi:hypothetical protein